jgi:hypothetical protein
MDHDPTIIWNDSYILHSSHSCEITKRIYMIKMPFETLQQSQLNKRLILAAEEGNLVSVISLNKKMLYNGAH